MTVSELYPQPRPQVEGPRPPAVQDSVNPRAIAPRRTHSLPVEITLLALAGLLYVFGLLLGWVSLPFNWAMGAVRAGWIDARQRGGI